VEDEALSGNGMVLHECTTQSPKDLWSTLGVPYGWMASRASLAEGLPLQAS